MCSLFCLKAKNEDNKMCSLFCLKAKNEEKLQKIPILFNNFRSKTIFAIFEK